jgi:hypothetical protein
MPGLGKNQSRLTSHALRLQSVVPRGYFGQVSHPGQLTPSIITPAIKNAFPSPIFRIVPQIKKMKSHSQSPPHPFADLSDLKNGK